MYTYLHTCIYTNLEATTRFLLAAMSWVFRIRTINCVFVGEKGAQGVGDNGSKTEKWGKSKKIRADRASGKATRLFPMK